MLNDSYLAVIDCAINEPVANCFNSIVARYRKPALYYSPRFCGMDIDLAKTSAVMILGSASSVNDNLDWQKSVFKLIEDCMSKKVPLMGLCFGHQAIAHVLGAKIDFVSADQKKLQGSREIKFEEDFGRIKNGDVIKVAVSHKEEVKNLTKDMKPLASSSVTIVEAFAHRELPCFGFQSHPEASRYFMANQVGIQNPKEIEDLRESSYRIVDAYFSLLQN